MFWIFLSPNSMKNSRRPGSSLGTRRSGASTSGAGLGKPTGKTKTELHNSLIMSIFQLMCTKKPGNTTVDGRNPKQPPNMYETL